MGGMGETRPRDPRWGRMHGAGLRACGRGCAGVKPQQVPREGGTGSRARRGGRGGCGPGATSCPEWRSWGVRAPCAAARRDRAENTRKARARMGGGRDAPHPTTAGSARSAGRGGSFQSGRGGGAGGPAARGGGSASAHRRPTSPPTPPVPRRRSGRGGRARGAGGGKSATAPEERGKCRGAPDSPAGLGPAAAQHGAAAARAGGGAERRGAASVPSLPPVPPARRARAVRRRAPPLGK